MTQMMTRQLEEKTPSEKVCSSTVTIQGVTVSLAFAAKNNAEIAFFVRNILKSGYARQQG